MMDTSRRGGGGREREIVRAHWLRGRRRGGEGVAAGRVHNGRAALIRPDHSYRPNVFYCPEA